MGGQPADPKNDSASLVAFLSDPANYPHASGPVRLIQTHISWVFVGQHWVYKVKKPVTFGFLDFGTPEKRKFYVEEEYRLNQRLAAPFYVGPVPLYQDKKGRWGWVGEGEPAEWILKMRRFPVGSELAERLTKGQVSRLDMQHLAGFLSGFYQRQMRSVPSEKRVWSPSTLIWNNFKQASPVLAGMGQQPALSLYQKTQRGHLKNIAPWLKERTHAGWVVEGHGDLQAGHVLFLKNPPHFAVFDCIEFSRDFRVADVAYDLSFLVMDLMERRREDLALALLAAFERRMGGAAVIPAAHACFSAHRALIRAKVLGLKSLDAGVPLTEQQQARSQALDYLQTSLRLCHLGLKPRWVVVMGNIASGKSTLARALGARLGVPVFNSDVVRKELFGLRPEDDGGPLAKKLYSPRATERTYGRLLQLARDAAKRSKPVLMDATFHSRARREAWRQAAAKAGVRVDFLLLDVAEPVLARRLKAREKGPSVSDARLNLLPAFLKSFEIPGPDETDVACIKCGALEKMEAAALGVLVSGIE